MFSARITQCVSNRIGGMNESTRNFIWLLIPAIAVGCSAEAERPAVPPRPVSFITLKTSNPSEMSRLTGTAESWKREEIAFEVSGRVSRIVEPGTNIVGRTLDEQGNLLSEGTILAELDDERYQIAHEQAEAGAEAVRTELEQVLPQQLNEAQANFELQKIQLARQLTIRAENPGATSQRVIDEADAAVKGATANVAKIEALRATKAAELNVLLAQIDQAKRNIRDCKLVSPFTGQIARVHVIPGGYAFRGIPVMTVQMMDPMKANIAVSPKTDELIDFNDIIHVYTPSGEKLDGYVYLKDTFADPATRTFLVTLLVRNRRFEVGVPADLLDQPIPRCRNLWALQRPEGQTSGNYYLDVNAIHQDDEGDYVWKAENLTVEQMSKDFSPVVTVRKARVTAGEGRIPVLQLYTFREIADLGGLDPEQNVIVGSVTGDATDGGQVILARQRWALRPGDVVRVGLQGEETPEGYYVPSDAIQFDGTSHYVVVAKGAEDGTHQVSFLPVTLGETVGSLQRIDGELEAGTKVIVEGAHYVQVGDQVNPVEEVEVQP
jgi:multidrug efflux pump subunit AcrA (membrane-fusion protein)